MTFAVASNTTPPATVAAPCCHRSACACSVIACIVRPSRRRLGCGNEATTRPQSPRGSFRGEVTALRRVPLRLRQRPTPNPTRFRPAHRALEECRADVAVLTHGIDTIPADRFLLHVSGTAYRRVGRSGGQRPNGVYLECARDQSAELSPRVPRLLPVCMRTWIGDQQSW